MFQTMVRLEVLEDAEARARGPRTKVQAWSLEGPVPGSFGARFET